MSGTEDPIELARAYYRALDGDDYDLLVELLAPEFTHVRPDTTHEGRERFVRFMREKRPVSDTTHPVDAVYRGVEPEEVVVRGRLLDADGGLITHFADVVSVEGGRIVRVETFTR